MESNTKKVVLQEAAKLFWEFQTVFEPASTTSSATCALPFATSCVEVFAPARTASSANCAPFFTISCF